MKLKDGLVLRKVAGQYVIVPVGRRTKEVQNMVYISSSAAYLWEHIKGHEFTAEDLVEGIMIHYTGVTRETAQADIEKFLAVLKRNNILEPIPGEEPEVTGGSVCVTIELPEEDEHGEQSL